MKILGFCVMILMNLKILKIVKCQQQSPCPEIFQFVNDDGENFGLIEYSEAEPDENYTIQLKMAIRGKIPNYDGEIVLIGGTDEAMETIKSSNKIKYRVVFPVQNRLPTIMEIRMNNKVICSGNKVPPLSTQIGLTHFYRSSISGDYTPSEPVEEPEPVEQPKPTKQSIPVLVSNGNRQGISDICGYSGSIRPYISGGNRFEKGAWPWMVAMFKINKNNLKFICAANIISSRTLITAAHCIKLKGTELKKENLYLLAGIHYLTENEDNTDSAKQLEIEQLILHPKYDPLFEKLDADIALIILKRQIMFNSFKRPICLWNYENNIRGVINRKGVIAGWGSDENNLVSTEPKMLEVSIADPDWCLRSNDEIARHTTNRTFCAGDRNGKGPCHGDSGTGISIIENGRWTLRGLVSATLNKQKSDNCDFKEFTIYTDVAQFIPWITNHIRP